MSDTQSIRDRLFYLERVKVSYEENDESDEMIKIESEIKELDKKIENVDNSK